MTAHEEHLVPAGDGTFVVVLESGCIECVETAIRLAINGERAASSRVPPVGALRPPPSREPSEVSGAGSCPTPAQDPSARRWDAGEATPDARQPPHAPGTTRGGGRRDGAPGEGTADAVAV